MIPTLVSAVKMIGSFFTHLLTDYISNIIVTAIIFPGQVIKEAGRTFNSIVKPITMPF